MVYYCDRQKAAEGLLVELHILAHTVNLSISSVDKIDPEDTQRTSTGKVGSTCDKANFPTFGFAFHILTAVRNLSPAKTTPGVSVLSSSSILRI